MCTTSFTPPLQRALPDFKFVTCVQSRLQLKRTGMATRKDLFGCPGDSPQLPWRFALVGQGNQVENVRFLFSPFSPLTMPPLWRIQHCLCREVDEIWQYRTGGNLTIFDKDHDTAGSRRFLQPSIRLRYNYYVQLVATRRD